nr:MAG TPA: hypothetical protein [Caudoviricetes sp.]
MDLLDILRGKYREVMTGSYYRSVPPTKDENAIQFDYEMADPKTMKFDQPMQNLSLTDAETTSISTDDAISFEVGKAVVLQDGKMYTIVSVQKDLSKASQQAYRYMGIPVGVRNQLYLVERENPWELNNA